MSINVNQPDILFASALKSQVIYGVIHLKKRLCVEIEKLLKEIVESYDQRKVDILFESLLDQWLYFFFNEQNYKDTRPGKGNIEVVLLINKENPIDVPLIENENGKNGVLYTNLELAKKSAEFKCKIGKMKGKNALDLFYIIKGSDGVYIQGNYGNILAIKRDLKKFQK